MSASFYFSPTSPESNIYDSDLIVDLDKFVDGLKALWPEIIIDRDSEDLGWLYWNLNYHDCDNVKDCMSGSMEPGRKYVYVDAHSKRETVARFAIWYRQLISDRYKLYVGASWGGYFDLLLKMQQHEILQAINVLET